MYTCDMPASIHSRPNSQKKKKNKLSVLLFKGPAECEYLGFNQRGKGNQNEYWHDAPFLKRYHYHLSLLLYPQP